MQTIEEINFKKQYNTIWETFAEGVKELIQYLMDYAEKAEEGSLHHVLQELQSVPYYQATGMFGAFKKPGENNDTLIKRSNIGSVTGVFFELVAASLVTGYINHHLKEEAKIELNSCGPLKESLPKGGGRDADIFVSYNNRYVIFETKVSPKKPDLDSVVKLREKYHSSGKPVEFFLIGGYVSADSKWIECAKSWACFTDSSKENKALLESYKLDYTGKGRKIFTSGVA